MPVPGDDGNQLAGWDGPGETAATSQSDCPVALLDAPIVEHTTRLPLLSTMLEGLGHDGRTQRRGRILSGSGFAGLKRVNVIV